MVPPPFTSFSRSKEENPSSRTDSLLSGSCPLCFLFPHVLCARTDLAVHLVRGYRGGSWECGLIRGVLDVRCLAGGPGCGHCHTHPLQPWRPLEAVDRGGKLASLPANQPL